MPEEIGLRPLIKVEIEAPDKRIVIREVYSVPIIGDTIIDSLLGEVAVLKVTHMTDTGKIRLTTVAFAP